ncbi:MAG: hypothetical protein V4726_22770 [Verrucomicrobiota bacterium]
MKPLLPGLLSITFGFVVSRLIPFEASVNPSVKPGVLSAPATPASDRSAVLEKASLKSSPDGEDWRAAAKAWMESDPAGFCRWLVKRGIPPEKELMQDLFTAWAEQDVEAAFAAVFNLPQDFQRQQEVMDRMLNAVIDQPGGLAAALRWSPAVDDQVNMIMWPGESWLKSSPPDQIAALLAEKATGWKYGGVLIGQFARFRAGQDQAAALAWAQSLPPEQHTSAFQGIMRFWAEKDPAAALDYLSREATSGDRFSSFNPLKELAKTDPKAALDWWENHLGVASPNCLESIFSPWCEAGAEEARDYALAIEDPTLRRNCLEAWAGQAKPGEVRAAIENVQDGRNRNILIETLARGSSDNDTGTFLRQLVEGGGTSATPAVTGNVSRHYAYKEPAAAFAWAGTLPARLQPAAVGAVLETWRDKVAAAQAVDQLPESSFKTAAAQALRNTRNLSGG